MKRKSKIRGFILRSVEATLLSCLVLVALSFSGKAAGSSSQGRTLSFAERVAYQRAIEEVYWRHRIWPKQGSDAKPSLDAVMSQAQLEKKVADYLRKSQALEDYWQRPLTAEQLQAEMDRMAQHTKQPEVLRELFAALGNDPFVIAECVARPALSERLLTNWYAYDERMHGELKHRAEAQLRMQSNIEQMKQTSGMYREIELLKGNSGPDEADRSEAHSVKVNSAEWGETVQRAAAIHTAHAPKSPVEAYESIPIGKVSSLQEDETCYYATAVLAKTADHLKVATVAWPKEPLTSWLARAENDTNTAITVPNGNYSLPGTLQTAGGCTEDTWAATSAPPDGQSGNTSVWTGSEMIVWGGIAGFFYSPLNTGGKYNPSTDSWTTTSTINAPAGRSSHTAVWTGTEMIVWGGYNGSYLRTGGRYNPDSDTWIATSTANAPAARGYHTAVWTGSHMIVWGGYNGTNRVNTGGRYDPDTNNWSPTSTTDAPAGRLGHTAV